LEKKREELPKKEKGNNASKESTPGGMLVAFKGRGE
jgi:hypothetical protein